VLGARVIASAVLAVVLLDRTPAYAPALRLIVPVAAVVAVAARSRCTARPSRRPASLPGRCIA